MILRSAIFVILATALLCGSAYAGDADSILTGNEFGLWYISFGTATSDTPDGEAEVTTFSVAGKLIDSPWQWVAEKIRGRLATATAAGKNLHVLFEGGAHQIFPLSGGSGKPGAKLPGESLAGCQSPAGFAGAVGPSLLAMTRTTSETGIGQVLYQYAGGQWREITTFDQSNIPADAVVMATTAGQDFFLLVWHPDNSTGDVHKFSNHTWTQIEITPDLGRANVIAFAGFQGQVTLLLGAGKDGQDSPVAVEEPITLTMASLDVTSHEWTFQPVSTDGQASTWRADKPPIAAQLGPERIAVIWTDAYGDLAESSMGLDGQLLPAAKLTFPVTSLEQAELLVVMEYFMWAVLIASMAAMFLFRPQGPPQPFVLDESIKNGSLFFRSFALLIDFLPFLFLGSVIFAPTDVIVTAENYKQVFEELSRQKEPTLAFVTALTLYTIYSFVMELRYGATVGKLIFRLRVIGNNGQPADFRSIVLRNLIRLLEINFLTFFPPFMLFYLVMIILNRYHQRLGDIMARTAVVDSRTLRFAETLADAEQQSEEQARSDNTDGPPELPGK